MAREARAAEEVVCELIGLVKRNLREFVAELVIELNRVVSHCKGNTLYIQTNVVNQFKRSVRQLFTRFAQCSPVGEGH